MIIYCIPGLGTSGEIFHRLSVPGYTLVPLEWPDFSGNETLGEYADKFAAQVSITKPFLLLGLSFGGMLAVELSRKIPCERLILISSVKTYKDLPWFVRMLRVVPLHKMFSEHLIRWVACRSRWILGFSREYMITVKKMIAQMPDNYFSFSIRCIVEWKSPPGPKPCVLIHGTADLLIPCHNSVDVRVENGSHAMVVEQASRLNAELLKVLRYK